MRVRLIIVFVLLFAAQTRAQLFDSQFLQEKFTSYDSGLQYYSTLHWQSNMVTNDLGESEFVFKTGDITDEFQIVVPGITSNGVISASKVFTVK